MNTKYHHSDYALLRDQLVGESWFCTHTSDFTEYWRAPHGGEIYFDIPEADPYESVVVYFEYPVTTQELQLLRFPL